MEGTIFGITDWIIIAATMILSVAIGVYFKFTGGKQKTNEEYLLGDRNMSVFPVAISLMASFMSAITLLGVCSENFYFGMQFVVINIAYGIGTPIATHLYLPVFFGLEKTSAYEYLELRFGPKLRLIASLTYTLQMVLYGGIVLYAPAIVIERVAGLDRVVSIIVVGLACTVYSVMGGMKAVVYTDLLQSLLMFVSVVCTLIYPVIQLGGFQPILDAAREGGRLDFSNFSVDPTERHTWWSLIIGGLFTYLSLNAVNQTQVQRLLTVSSLKRSQLCLFISWPVLSLLSVITCFSGLAIYAIYKDCDPLSAGYITATDQLMPHYVVDSMLHIPGLVGLFIAGICSASLSTISSACNSLAAVTLSDYVDKYYPLRPSLVPWFTKAMAGIYGVLFLALAFLAQHLGGILQAALTIFGAVGGPLFGVFTLGMCTTYATETGAALGLVLGMIFTLVMSFGTPRPAATMLPLSVEGCLTNVTMPTPVVTNPSDYFYMYRISYMWTSPIGFALVIIIGTTVSLLWRQQQPWEKMGRTHPDPALFTPILAKRIRARLQNEKADKMNVECNLLQDIRKPY